MTYQQEKRSGSVLICVLVCLAIVTALAASMLQTALQARKAVRQEIQLSQSEFLLAAGVQRAAEQLSDDPAYTGETWQLTSAAIPGQESALVEIKVTPVAADGSALVEVIAQLPADSPLSARRSYTFSLSNEE